MFYETDQSVHQSRGVRLQKFIEARFLYQAEHIVRTDCIFNQRRLIHLLKERGQAIKLENQENLKKIETQISELKEDFYMSEFIGAHVIFQTQQQLYNTLEAFQNDPEFKNSF